MPLQEHPTRFPRDTQSHLSAVRQIDVSGDDAHLLYKHLTSAAPELLGSETIKWNFTKFLVDRMGNVMKRNAPNTAPADLTKDIEKALAAG